MGFIDRLLTALNIRMDVPENIVTPVGHELWLVSNAVAFVFITILIFIGFFFLASSVSNIAEIKKNWNKYRCDPSIMPFASIYGYDTASNFNYCMGSIFQTHSADMSSSFTSILGAFTTTIATLMGSVNSIRTSVATLGGGVNTVFQNITNRISNFFFQLRLSAIHIKYLMSRMYAVMFAVMYMGMSSITGLTSFTETSLFGFLDTFCFPPETLITVDGRGHVPISEIRIGDILLPTNSRVTATFQFKANGQPMIRFNSDTGGFIVSTNHYLMFGNKLVRADKHPDGIRDGKWNSDIPLHCLNTNNHRIPVGNYEFCDYDETEEGDFKTMKMVETQINSIQDIYEKPYPFKEYSPAINGKSEIMMKNGTSKWSKNVKIGDILSTGATVIGVIEREVSEVCEITGGNVVTSATCIWHDKRWERAGTIFTVQHRSSAPEIFITFIVVPSSLIELRGGIFIRDYMEVCSPDSEKHYTELLSTSKAVLVN